MTTGRLEKLAPYAGFLFFAVFAVGFVAVGETPEPSEPGSVVIEHYDDTAKIATGALALMLGGVALMFFIGALRRRFLAAGSEWLTAVFFAGAIIFTASLGIFASTQFALLEAADNQQTAVAETLNVLDSTNFGMSVIGLAVLYFGAAAVVLTSHALPRWLGWVALVLGVVGVAGPLGFFAFLAFPIFVLIVSVILVRETDAPAPTAGVA